jgi:predicted amidohydrolase
MKVRTIQFSPVLGDISKNLIFHKTKIEEAKKDKIDLIIFPELSISGYYLKDIVYDISLKPEDDVISEFKKLSRDIDIILGVPFEEEPGIIYNSALYFSNEKLIHNHRKVQLPNFGMFEEKMIFKQGSLFKSFKINNFTAGILICREILFPINAYLYYLQNVDFIVALSNSPYRGMRREGFASLKLWERLGEVYAINFHQNYVFVNRSGFEDGVGFGGGSFYASSGEEIRIKAKYFEEDILDFEINEDSVRRSRIASNYLRDEKPELILKELNRILNV